VKLKTTLITGMLMFGKMSVGVRKAEAVPKIRISTAMTMNVYGRRKASRTIPIIGVLPRERVPSLQPPMPKDAIAPLSFGTLSQLPEDVRAALNASCSRAATRNLGLSFAFVKCILFIRYMLNLNDEAGVPVA
jgi:hypothetical protein